VRIQNKMIKCLESIRYLRSKNIPNVIHFHNGITKLAVLVEATILIMIHHFERIFFVIRAAFRFLSRFHAATLKSRGVKTISLRKLVTIFPDILRKVCELLYTIMSHMCTAYGGYGRNTPFSHPPSTLLYTHLLFHVILHSCV